MQVFDRIDPRKLDQRDAELWILAIVTILILAGGMALVVYPAAYSGTVTLSGGSVRKIFFSFCVLCVLLVGYLTERRVTIRRLRKQLEEERTRSSHLLGQASAELLGSLPGFEQFREGLALDYSRAAAFRQPLSLVVMSIKISQQVVDAGETSTAYVDAVKAMIRKMRSQDSIYLLAAGVFGILLPGVFGDHANRVSERLSEGLTDASGANKRFSFELRVINYPQHAAAAEEMEQLAQAFLTEARSEGQPV